MQAILLPMKPIPTEIRFTSKSLKTPACPSHTMPVVSTHQSQVAPALGSHGREMALILGVDGFGELLVIAVTPLGRGAFGSDCQFACEKGPGMVNAVCVCHSSGEGGYTTTPSESQAQRPQIHLASSSSGTSHAYWQQKTASPARTCPVS